MEKSMDSRWNELHTTVEWGQYPTESVIRFVARNYYKKERKNIKILDFGCGQGAHTWYLAREGFDTYAFDGAADAVQKTEQKLKREGLSVNLGVYDALNLPYEDNFFDLVIDVGCICCNKYSDSVRMYQKIYQILRGGGKLLSSGFGHATTGYGLGKEIETGTFEGITKGNLIGLGTIHFTTKDELCQTFTKCGFRNCNVDYIRYSDQGNDIEQLIAYGEKCHV